MPTAPTKIAMAVDDSEIVLKSFRRVLSQGFDEVFTASNPIEAEAVLQQCQVTHVVCDFHLGDGVPFGTELISDWRRRFPCIQRAVIVSGSLRDEIVPPPEVDAVLGKPVTMAELIEALGIKG